MASRYAFEVGRRELLDNGEPDKVPSPACPSICSGVSFGVSLHVLTQTAALPAPRLQRPIACRPAQAARR